MPVTYENNNQQERLNDGLYSKRLKAGKRRTYFFDVRTTRGNDYFLTITESKKRFSDNGYDRHKIFLYKEDFNKFIIALGEAIDYVKTELLPDFDFDQFNHDDYDHQELSASEHESREDSKEQHQDQHQDQDQDREQRQETEPEQELEQEEVVGISAVAVEEGNEDDSSVNEDVDKW